MAPDAVELRIVPGEAPGGQALRRCEVGYTQRGRQMAFCPCDWANSFQKLIVCRFVVPSSLYVDCVLQETKSVLLCTFTCAGAQAEPAESL